MAEGYMPRAEKRVDWGRGRVTNYPGFSTENPASQEMPQLYPGKLRHLVIPRMKCRGRIGAWL